MQHKHNRIFETRLNALQIYNKLYDNVCFVLVLVLVLTHTRTHIELILNLFYWILTHFGSMKWISFRLSGYCIHRMGAKEKTCNLKSIWIVLKPLFFTCSLDKLHFFQSASPFELALRYPYDFRPKSNAMKKNEEEWKVKHTYFWPILKCYPQTCYSRITLTLDLISIWFVWFVC